MAKGAGRRNSTHGPANKLPGNHLLRAVLTQLEYSYFRTMDPHFDANLALDDFDWTGFFRVSNEQEREVVFALCKALIFSKQDLALKAYISIVIEHVQYILENAGHKFPTDPEAHERIEELLKSLRIVG